MKPLVIRILLAVLVVVSIGAGLHTEQDTGVQLARAERLLKKGDVKQARVIADSIINGNLLKYNSIASEFERDIRTAKDSRVLLILIEQARAWTKANKPYKKEWELYHCGNAMLYEEMGRLGDAETELKKALSLSPQSPDLLNALGWFYADNGIELDQALKLTRKATRLAPDSAAIVDSLGWAYYKLGNYGDGVATLRHAVELDPERPELRYHLGAAYLKHGCNLQAFIELNKALLLKPSMPEPRNLLKRLK